VESAPAPARQGQPARTPCCRARHKIAGRLPRRRWALLLRLAACRCCPPAGCVVAAAGAGTAAAGAGGSCSAAHSCSRCTCCGGGDKVTRVRAHVCRVGVCVSVSCVARKHRCVRDNVFINEQCTTTNRHHSSPTPRSPPPSPPPPHGSSDLAAHTTPAHAQHLLRPARTPHSTQRPQQCRTWLRWAPSGRWRRTSRRCCARSRRSWSTASYTRRR
jgi:hypothetical protein